MSSLEEKSIATLRASLLRANSHKLCSTWNLATDVKGGNEHGVFDHTLSRDVIAYTACRFLFMRNLRVFGGFVRSHYSGKPWNDIDIMLASDANPGEDYKLMGTLIDFVTMMLCLPKHCMSFVIHSPGPYGKSADLKIRLEDRDDIVIKFDLVRKGVRNIATAIPVSVGSCLEMVSTTHVRFRQDNQTILRRVNHLDVTDIVELLQNGQDIKLCLNTPLSSSQKQQYRNYYWCKITKMTSLQWEFVNIDGSEPPAFTEEELYKLMREFTRKKVQQASVVVE